MLDYNAGVLDGWFQQQFSSTQVLKMRGQWGFIVNEQTLSASLRSDEGI